MRTLTPEAIVVLVVVGCVLLGGIGAWLQIRSIRAEESEALRRAYQSRPLPPGGQDPTIVSNSGTGKPSVSFDLIKPKDDNWEDDLDEDNPWAGEPELEGDFAQWEWEYRCWDNERIYRREEGDR